MLRRLPFLVLLLAGLIAQGCGKKEDNADPACLMVDCGDHGTCDDGRCECADGYRGANCQFPPSCVPMCASKICGDNGCGGLCGFCPEGEMCTDGQCGCDSSCTNRECGNNGCGDPCGTCSGSSVCDPNGRCCMRGCAGKTCGDDGCGGSCGNCAGSDVCIQGQCGVDSGLGCIERTVFCASDGDCDGVENACRAPPKMSCSRPVIDCGSETTVCKSLQECWKSCANDGECAAPRAYCVDGLCQACREDAHCANGLPCVNNNARRRCESPDDCPTFSAEMCI
jgi:hypothetical protein